MIFSPTYSLQGYPLPAIRFADLLMQGKAVLGFLQPAGRTKPIAMIPHLGAADSLKQTRDMSATLAVIALASRLIMQQGTQNQERFLAFRAQFPLHASEDGKILKLLHMAAQESAPLDHYVRQIMRLYPSSPALYADTVSRLLHVAASDAISLDDYRTIGYIARHFGLGARQFRKVAAAYPAPRANDPYALLNVRRQWSLSAIRTQYNRLMKDAHPDAFMAKGASHEMLARQTRRAAEINAAYTQILTMRGAKHA